MTKYWVSKTIRARTSMASHIAKWQKPEAVMSTLTSSTAVAPLPLSEAWSTREGGLNQSSSLPSDSQTSQSNLLPSDKTKAQTSITESPLITKSTKKFVKTSTSTSHSSTFCPPTPIKSVLSLAQTRTPSKSRAFKRSYRASRIASRFKIKWPSKRSNLPSF